MEYKADIVIYGGTSAAVIAAVQAARMKRSVILVSPDEHLGGMSISGLGWTDVGNKDAIGGLAREFYRKVFKHYEKEEAWTHQTKESYGNQGQDTPAADPENKTMWIFEPHVAESIFEEMIKSRRIKIFRGELLDRKRGIRKREGFIQSIRTLVGNTFKGKMFIDATYEGDLMAAAGASYTVGREGNAMYNETWNGIQMDAHHHDHYFKQNISPYIIPDDPTSGLLPRISPYAPRVQGYGDKAIQAYCFRLCLTKHPENRVPIEKPNGYDPWQYEILRRLLDKGWNEVFYKFDPIPNKKTDVNNHGPFSFDNIGMNWDYPEASYERRQQIIAEHRLYQQGLLYFLANDPSIPRKIKTEMRKWGYAKDEFVDNGHWPYQLYVREARRMLGSSVMTDHHILGLQSVPHPIGMGSYVLDSHNVQRYITCQGFVQNEGDIGVVPPHPYGIDLGTILPKVQDCKNLLVPVAVSASHPAFGSLRMEPVFMTLGQSAATLASLALETKQRIHDVEYGELKKRLLADGQVLELAA